MGCGAPCLSPACIMGCGAPCLTSARSSTAVHSLAALLRKTRHSRILLRRGVQFGTARRAQVCALDRGCRPRTPAGRGVRSAGAFCLGRLGGWLARHPWWGLRPTPRIVHSLSATGGYSARQGHVLRRVRCGSVLLHSTAPVQKQGVKLPAMCRRRSP